MITLYGIQSPHVARVRAALIMKELPFQHVSVNLANRSSEFQQLAPHGKIPVIKDEDGTVVCDSYFITQYLDKKYPHTYKMIPDDPRSIARLGAIMDIITTISFRIEPLYVELFNMQERLTTAHMKHRAILYNGDQKEDLNKDIFNKLETLKTLKKGKFFLEEFSYVDAAVLATLNTLEFMGIPTNPLKEWKEELLKEEKIAQMFAPKEEKGITEI